MSIAPLRQFITRLPTPLHLNGEVGLIGLEFAIENLHMVQFESHAGKPRLRACTSLAYPQDRDALMDSPRLLKMLLREVFKAHPFIGKRVVTVLPPGRFRIMLVNYQLSNEAAEAQAILRLMGERLEGELQDYVIDYLPVRKSDRESNQRVALIMAARRNAVLSYLEFLRKAGLKVMALEVGPVSIHRLVKAIHKDAEQANTLVINFGRHHSFLTVLSGDRLLFDREVKFGEDMLIKRVSQVLELSPEMARHLLYDRGFQFKPYEGVEWVGEDGSEFSETLTEIVKPTFLELVEEVNKALIYTASETRGQPVERLYLGGGIARWPSVDRWLKTLIKVPVSVLDPLSEFVDDKPFEQIPALAVAAGLALRGLTGHG